MNDAIPQETTESNIELHHPRWNQIWSNGLPPGSSFDKGCVSPALELLIHNGEIPSGRALVPGCGRGYDVAALAAKERHIIMRPFTSDIACDELM